MSLLVNLTHSSLTYTHRDTTAGSNSGTVKAWKKSINLDTQVKQVDRIFCFLKFHSVKCEAKGHKMPAVVKTFQRQFCLCHDFNSIESNAKQSILVTSCEIGK